ncbi:hypothetical protein L596_028372 [Steinernema carpocapsae]|uniref:Uncharacterized protein n=1 Tax=Steinernema carpocapsae TaxID=34508 RepID=A0A4U5LYB7_STECR|nr:hypothetical protein L596_028372 [Steinernema carpocapsae]
MKTLLLFVAFLAVALAQYTQNYNNNNQNRYPSYNQQQTYGQQYTTQNPYGYQQQGYPNQVFRDQNGRYINSAASTGVMWATALTVIAARFF